MNVPAEKPPNPWRAPIIVIAALLVLAGAGFAIVLATREHRLDCTAALRPFPADAVVFEYHTRRGYDYGLWTLKDGSPLPDAHGRSAVAFTELSAPMASVACLDAARIAGGFKLTG